MSSTTIGNSIMIALKINFKDALYPTEFYQYLKEFFSKIIDIQTNSIIFLKRRNKSFFLILNNEQIST